jgi:MFS family permease
MASGTDEKQARIFTPKLSLFLFSMILANLGGSLFYPFFSIYLNKLGLPVETIGLFFTISAIFPLIFQILGGWISDRIGRLASIAIGSVAGAVAWVATLIAPSTGNPLPWFLASNAVSAITVALVSPSFDAFIAEQANEKNRGRVFATIQSIFLIVGIAGPPLGGLIAERLSYGTLAWIAAILYWAATLIRVAMARPESRARTKDSSEEKTAGGLRSSFRGILALFLAGGAFMWIVLIDGAFDISGKLSGDLLPLFIKQIGGQSESRIGLLQGASALVMALAMVPLGSFSDRHGERLPIVAGCVLYALSLFILWLHGSFVSFALSFLFSGLAGAAIQPAMQSLTSKAVPQNLRGLAYGFLGTSLGLFSFFAPALGGFLWHRFFPALPFLAAGLLVLAAAIPAWAHLAPRRP